jgi:hypothetical protein
MKKLIIPALLLITVAVIAVVAKDKIGMSHDQHSMDPMMHNAKAGGMPKETGDAGFAAIAEIVSLLSNDPNTDWTKVDINGLREHLVMMNQLVLGAIVEEQEIPNGRRFNVRGSEIVLKAIQQMVPAHSVELNKMDEFTVVATPIEGGYTMDVLGNDMKTNAKIKGLGFFGLMATGSHHQMHHLMMASGQGHH